MLDLSSPQNVWTRFDTFMHNPSLTNLCTFLDLLCDWSLCTLLPDKKTVWQINLKEWWLFSRTWVGPHSFSRCHCGFHKQSELSSCSPESSLHYVLIDGNSVKRGELVAIFISLHCKYSFRDSELWVPHSVTSLYRPFCLFAQMAADPFKVGEVSSQSSHREGSLDYMTMTIHWM